MKRETKGQSIAPQWKRIALGAGAGVLTLLTAAGAAAGLVSREAIGLGALGWCAAAALVLAGFVAGKTGGKPLDAALAAVGVAVVLLGLNFGLFDGKMEGFGASALALAGGCGAALLLRGGNRDRRSSRRRRKIVKLPKSRVR